MSKHSIGSPVTHTQPVLETLAGLLSGYPRRPGPWWVNGDRVCSEEITLRINGGFDSGAERREFLEDLCRRLNARQARQRGPDQ